MDITLPFILEVTAAIAGFVCVFLQTRENVWAWPAGILSVALYAYIFRESSLYSDMILNSIFVVLNIYGWWNWLQRGPDQESIKVTRLTKQEIITWTLVIIFGTLGWGYIMDSQTDASFAYGDAFTTAASLVAQYLLARKVLENWPIWIIANIVSIFIYTQKELYPTTILFMGYFVLAILGYITWKRTLEGNITSTGLSD